MFKTNDLGTAAFLMIKGCTLNNAYIDDKRIFVFEFAGDKAKNRQFAIQYLNSECAMFDAQVKNLKKILNTRYT